MATFKAELKNVLSDDDRQRTYAQNSIIVDTAVALQRALDVTGITQKELAKRLGRSERFISQVLSGGGNMTLRTLGDLAYGLECVVDVCLRPREPPAQSEVEKELARFPPAMPTLVKMRQLLEEIDAEKGDKK